MGTYTYFGPSDGLSHSQIVNEARREAIRVTGERGWNLDYIHYEHDEVQNESTKKWESEAKVIVRQATPTT